MHDEAILRELQRLNQIVSELSAKLDRYAAGQGVAQGTRPVNGAGADMAVADDADLDGQYGNPTVRKDPRDWTGESMVGKTYAECPPDFLEMLAKLIDWQASKSAEKNEMTAQGKPRADYLKRDAARARGWARRNNGMARTSAPRRPAPAAAAPAPAPAARRPVVEEPEMMGTDDDIPFLSAAQPV